MAHSVRIENDDLYEEIVSYCRENGITIGKFCERLIDEGFSIEKYGDFPYGEIRRSSPPHEDGTEEIPLKDARIIPDSAVRIMREEVETDGKNAAGEPVDTDEQKKKKPRKRVL